MVARTRSRINHNRHRSRVDACTRTGRFYIDAVNRSLIMLKITPVFLVCAFIFAMVTFAQQAAPRGQASDKPSTTPPPGSARSQSAPPPSSRHTATKTTTTAAASAPGAATPAPERPGFFKRLFGRKPRAEATPTPAPKTKATAPPATSRKTRRTSSETSSDAEDTSTQEKGSATNDKKEGDDTAAGAPKRKLPKDARAKGATPPPDLGSPEAQEKWKYDEAHKRALEDPDVQALKQKADGVTDPEDGRRALRAYNKALFNKMRSIDPSVKERVDAIEAGVMKRLGD